MAARMSVPSRVDEEPDDGSRSLPALVLAAAALGLFLVWSNSFIAVSYLLGGEGASASFDWVGLTVARFLPAAAICLAYCLLFRRRETVEIVRGYWGRLLVCGLLAVPCYNCALYFGQQQGVPAPVASLTTALLPLFVIILSRLFLNERLTARQLVGFAISIAGLLVIASGRAFRSELGSEADGPFLLHLGITALAPLSWSLFSLLSQPVTRRVSSVLWTFLSIVAGSIPLLFIAPWNGLPQMASLPSGGVLALVYLAIPCTVGGFAVWTWLLKHLPASTVGLTVFLNPPLTTISKLALQALFPATFLFAIGTRDLLGGAIALLGLAVAVLRRGK